LFQEQTCSRLFDPFIGGATRRFNHPEAATMLVRKARMIGWVNSLARTERWRHNSRREAPHVAQ
jgi:hypothetical protein